MRTSACDLYVLGCTALFVFDNYAQVGAGLGWTGPVVHSWLFAGVVLLALHVARGALKGRIQSFLLFGLLVTLACIAYFGVLFHYLLAVQGGGGLVSHAEIPLDQLPHATGHYTLYFSLTTFLSVGYGDIHPQTPLLMLAASVEALMGYVMTVLLITAGLDRIRGQRWGARMTPQGSRTPARKP